MSGSSEKLIVVPYQKGYRLRQFIILMCFSVCAGVGGYYLGEFQIKYRHGLLAEEADYTSETLAELEKKYEALSQQHAILKRGQAVDEEAKKSVQKTIKDLETTVSQLREDVTFYKNIMAPSGNNAGLQVQKLEVDRLRDANKYSYKLVLAQVANNKSYIQGVVAVNFIGSKNGESEILALRDISEETELGIKFRFRYFQNIEGELVFPEGFVPEKIQVVAQSKGKKAAKIEESYSWELGGNGVYVGKKS